MFYRKIRIPDFKNQNPDYLDFYECGVFFLIGLD